MLKRRIRSTGTATSAADLRHITGRQAGMIILALATALTGVVTIAPRASAATACVFLDFGQSNTYQRCVRDEQVLLNDLWNAGRAGPNQLLTVDGFYGPHTVSDVESFQRAYALSVDGITGPQTWDELCLVDAEWGFTGPYYRDVGVAPLLTEAGSVRLASCGSTGCVPSCLLDDAPMMATEPVRLPVGERAAGMARSVGKSAQAALSVGR